MKYLALCYLVRPTFICFRMCQLPLQSIFHQSTITLGVKVRLKLVTLGGNALHRRALSWKSRQATGTWIQKCTAVSFILIINKNSVTEISNCKDFYCWTKFLNSNFHTHGLLCHDHVLSFLMIATGLRCPPTRINKSTFMEIIQVCTHNALSMYQNYRPNMREKETLLRARSGFLPVTSAWRFWCNCHPTVW